MAAVMVRWEARWPPARRPDLRLMFGPGGTVGQDAIWDRVRSTPAGRRLLANGPGYYADPSAAPRGRRRVGPPSRRAPRCPRRPASRRRCEGGLRRRPAGRRAGRRGASRRHADRAGRSRRPHRRAADPRGRTPALPAHDAAPRCPRRVHGAAGPRPEGRRLPAGVTFRGEGLRDSTVATVRVRRCARPVGARVCPIPPR